MAIESDERGAARGIPQPRGVVLGGGDDPRAVGLNAALYRVAVACEGGERGAARRIPQPRRVVLEAVTSRLPSGLNAALQTKSAWPSRCASGRHRGIPQPRRVVLGGGDDALAVGAERRAVDRFRVTYEGGEAAPVAASHSRAVLSIGGGDDAACRRG